MKRVTKTVEVRNHQWGILVDRIAMSEVVTALLEYPAFGFTVDNDFGGSGMWKLTFHKDYDVPDINCILGGLRENIVGWFEVEGD